MDPVVHLRSAVCLLGRFPALAGVDLEVTAGEIVLLSGPNGAGKSTLLRVIAGLIPVIRGEAVVCGVDLRRHRREVRRHVGYLGHAGGLYDDLTVLENLRFWARAAGADGDGAVDTLALTGVDPRLHGVVTGRLSAGQRRRVALAAVLVRRPEVLLLDEPHAGLDRHGRDLLDGLVAAAAAGGAAVLLASHELERVTPLVSRTVVVAGGRDLTPEAVGVA
jgi:heme ABC exporter ATP-binding subunit CcmA